MRSVVLVLLAFAAASCQTTSPTATNASGVQYAGGDGTTPELAIVISAADESAGVDAEYAWIRAHLPGAKLESQGLIHGPKIYDRFEITLPSGETREVFFDISSFFGKH